jgi:protein-disulfide isomerase
MNLSQAHAQFAAFTLLSPTTWLTGQLSAANSPGAAAAETAEESEQRRTVTVLNGTKLAVEDWPLIGNANAEIVFAEMLDYTCPHCRKTHAAVHGTLQTYGDRAALIVLPVPLDRTCNPSVTSTGSAHAGACEIAKLAIAVWRVEPGRFAEFHNWLMTTPPNYQSAYQHAARMVDEDRLRKELASDIPTAYIEKNVQLYQRAGAGVIPKMLFPNATVVGEITSPEKLTQLVRAQTGQ